MKALKEIKIFVCIMSFTTLLIGCNNKNIDVRVHGGDIIKNNIIMASERYLAYELPIITNSKIETFEIEEYEVIGEGDYDIKFEKLVEGEEYNGWYYYYANLQIKVSNDVEADFYIKSAIMNINDQNIEYEISDLHFSNAKTFFGSNYDTEKKNFVYNCEKTFLYQYIPSETTQTMSIAIQKDCTITGFEILDFVTIENLTTKVNEQEVEFGNGLAVKEGDVVTFDYTLNYKEGVSDTNLLKTTSYITYLDENNKECAFVDEQGLMIINYQNDNFVKDYIDTKLGGE